MGRETDGSDSGVSRSELDEWLKMCECCLDNLHIQHVRVCNLLQSVRLGRATAIDAWAALRPWAERIVYGKPGADNSPRDRLRLLIERSTVAAPNRLKLPRELEPLRGPILLAPSLWASPYHSACREILGRSLNATEALKRLAVAAAEVERCGLGDNLADFKAQMMREYNECIRCLADEQPLSGRLAGDGEQGLVDGPVPPDGYRLRGVVISLTETQLRIVDRIYTGENHSRPVEDVLRFVWSDGLGERKTLDSYVSEIRVEMRSKGCPLTIETANRCYVIRPPSNENPRKIPRKKPETRGNN